MYLLYQGGTIGQAENLLGIFGLILVCMSQERRLTPGFDIARCCGRRKMKDLIRRWVSMKRKRKRIRVRWRWRGRAGHSVIPSSSYLPTLKYNIPTFWTMHKEQDENPASGNWPHGLTAGLRHTVRTTQRWILRTFCIDLSYTCR